MGFTWEDIEKVLRIINECGECELHMAIGELELSVAKGDVQGFANSRLGRVSEDGVERPVRVAGDAGPGPTAEAEEDVAVEIGLASAGAEEAAEAGLVAIQSSVVSIFYRRPSPDEPPFVEVGSEVHEETVVCLLEVMKCFRSVPAGVKGRIEKICVGNGQLVEKGTVLFWVRPT